MKVVFLDIDGVLNSIRFMQTARESWNVADPKTMIDPEAVKLLNIIAAPDDARIVISSTWRRLWTPAEIARAMAIRGFVYLHKVIGATPRVWGPRAEEIRAWLAKMQRRPAGFVILDDDSDAADAGLQDHFVQTNVQIGLTLNDATRASRILGST